MVGGWGWLCVTDCGRLCVCHGLSPDDLTRQRMRGPGPDRSGSLGPFPNGSGAIDPLDTRSLERGFSGKKDG